MPYCLEIEGDSSMWSGVVISLHITTAEAQPMIEIQEAHAVPGKGLEGDRYFLGTGHFSRHHGPSYEVTLIEGETIDALNAEYEGLRIQPGDTRRNIVTCGVPLNHLVAHRFQVGEVMLCGIRLCHPCLHIANVVHHSLLAGLVNRGGLRAQILSEGIMRVGDIIRDLGEEQLPDIADIDERDVAEAASSSAPARV